jgi:hypothetical protein
MEIHIRDKKTLASKLEDSKKEIELVDEQQLVNKKSKKKEGESSV